MTVEAPPLPGCALRLVRGARNGPSPEWTAEAPDYRSGCGDQTLVISPTQDLTTAPGPLAVFDAKKVQGNPTVPPSP